MSTWIAVIFVIMIRYNTTYRNNINIQGSNIIGCIANWTFTSYLLPIIMVIDLNMCMIELFTAIDLNRLE